MVFFKEFIYGVIISISQIVPGISGGSIAMILGIYDKLIHAVNNIVKDFKNQYKILFRVGLGAIVGIILFSNIFKTLLEKYPIPLGYMFIGIILGGAPLMFKKATSKRSFSQRSLVYLVIGFVTVLLMSGDYNGYSDAIVSLTPFIFMWLFVGGVVIAIALILPGISGSFMLLILGLYNTVITAITDFNIPILIPIALGGIVGTVLSARLIEMLLNKYPEQTYMIIFGFILGSVFGVFPGFDGINSLIGIVLGIVGFIVTSYISKEDIHTGAVIITGETARKENANDVLHTLSGFAGDFVVATAGPDLESIISGKGAGAHIYSKEHSTTIVNIDIGGGTSNIASFKRGEVTDTGCLDIGGRLVKIDKISKKITYISPKIDKIIKDNNLNLQVGTMATVENTKPIVDIMVDLLMESIGLRKQTPLFDFIITNKSISIDENIKNVSFSGGVADYIYYDGEIKDYFEYGDLGILLGQAIKNCEYLKKVNVVKSMETIRATVVGAGSHT
ncbi:undecaprenyl phosphate translocase family protein, partial [Clostridium sp.]|uniref:undecaprenyl phosphate translocase family protein n=1 Tax=Clostridium sp. TaxID=1506 RepID=UPI0029145FCD